MASQARPYITCHVLDTVSGKPAASVNVKLQLLSSTAEQSASWTAQTNADGRVAQWSGAAELNSVVDKVKATASSERWCLTFDTESYFGSGNTFWPEVDLKFVTKFQEEHYHVPLLLGPWSFTTYRGS